MSYHIKLSDNDLEDAVKRIARSQVDKAIGEIDDNELPVGEKIHQLRKRGKKIRGLIRLVRPGFDEYSRENAIFRDAARTLAPMRDSIVMIETLDALVEKYQDELEETAFLPIRDELLEAVSKQTVDEEVADLLADFRTVLTDSRERIDDWEIDTDGFEPAAGGLHKTYGRAVKALETALDEPDGANLHELRKRVKYHWYHARLLREIWPGLVKKRRNLADDLGDLLGDHHDYVVFHRRLAELSASKEAPDATDVLNGLLEERKKVCEREAFTLARRMFAEKPKAMAKRWGAYWSIWREAA